MRVTMSMIAKQYNKSLNDNLSSLNDANNRTITLRKFNTVDEDPFSASKAYQLRREYQQNQNYQSNLSDVQSSLEAAETSATTINSIAQEASATDVIQAINGTINSDGRATIAKKLRSMQEAIVTTMNVQFGNQYLFGGSGSSAAPFSVDASGNLLYRGVNVDTGENSNGATSSVNGTKIGFGAENGTKLNAYTITIEKSSVAGSGVGSINVGADKNITITLNADGATNQQLQDSLQGTQLSTALGAAAAGIDFSKITVSGNSTATVPGSEVLAGVAVKSQISNIVDLDALANEKVYVDLGLGLKVNDDNTVQSQSAFNVAMPGISYLGYGKSANGTPQNLYSIMGKIADQLESSSFSMDTIQPYITAFDSSEQNLLTKITDIGARTNTLEYTQTRLENLGDNLLAKGKKVEYVESVDAIMDFKMQEYAYTAALQMGTKILQPTFLDFMK